MRLFCVRVNTTVITGMKGLLKNLVVVSPIRRHHTVKLSGLAVHLGSFLNTNKSAGDTSPQLH